VRFITNLEDGRRQSKPKWLFLLGLVFGLGIIYLSKPSFVFASTLINAKDTISNSRPSAIATLGIGASVNSTQLILGSMSTNNSRYITGDGAYLVGGPGTNEVINIASMSAIAGNTAALYLTSPTTQSHNVGATAMMAATAQHQIIFQTVNPANGSIQITFPTGNATNQSYPSFNGFSFNGLASGQLSASFLPAGPTCSGWTITAASGLVQCNLGTGITGPTEVTINIGLTTTNPVLVNPAKTNSVGSQDAWTIRIKTADANGTEKDSTKVRVATIEGVEVYATVDPYINFIIAGRGNNQAVNIGNSGCLNTETINTGISSGPSEVNLGVLGAAQVNLSAQLLTIATNGEGGFALTATTSGHLRDADVGYWLPDAQGTPTYNDTPDPVVLTTGNPSFGIHPCGQDVYTTVWNANASNCVSAGSPGTCRYANPAATFYYTIAQDTTGPIGSGSADGGGDGLTTMEYAATINNLVPAGQYRTTVTYVATATF
jgi:hypothetical protein